MSPKSKEGVKKLVSVLVISMPITGTKKKAVETIETAGANKDGKKSESEYQKSLIQVLCI